jgi:uncharacterized membrane protein YkoI
MTRSTLLALMLTCSVACLGCAVLAAEEAQDSKEEKVKLEDCPQAVQDTLKKASAGGKIEEIEKETENGKVVYEAEVVIEGDEYEVKVADDGKLLGKKLENDDDDDDGDDEDEDDD